MRSGSRRSASLAAVVGLASLVAGCKSSEPKPEPPPPEVAPARIEPETAPPPPKKAPPPKTEPAPVAAGPREIPPVTEADLARAREAYARGDLAAVAKIAGLERPEREDMPPPEREARLLVRRAKLVQALMSGVARSPLASGDGVERLEIQYAGHVVGRVVPKGDRLRVISFGVETEVAADDVLSRTKVERSEYQRIVRARLADKEARAKPDDALGHFRCAYYAWTYGLDKDAMPHVDATLGADDFPVVARVFAPKRAPAIVAEWRSLTGHPAAAAPASPAAPVADPATPAAETPPATATPPVAAETRAQTRAPGDPSFKKVRELYEVGVGRYRASFGEAQDPDKAIRDALKSLNEARDQLEALTHGQPDSDEAEELRVLIQSLLFDVRKRSHI